MSDRGRLMQGHYPRWKLDKLNRNTEQAVTGAAGARAVEDEKSMTRITRTTSSKNIETGKKK